MQRRKKELKRTFEPFSCAKLPPPKPNKIRAKFEEEEKEKKKKRGNLKFMI